MRGSLKDGRLKGQLRRLMRNFTFVYVLVEIEEDVKVSTFNYALNFDRSFNNFYLKGNMSASVDIAFVCNLVKLEFPSVEFLWSFCPEDSVEYLRYLKRIGGDLTKDRFLTLVDKKLEDLMQKKEKKKSGNGKKKRIFENNHAITKYLS